MLGARRCKRLGAPSYLVVAFARNGDSYIEIHCARSHQVDVDKVSMIGFGA